MSASESYSGPDWAQPTPEDGHEESKVGSPGCPTGTESWTNPHYKAPSSASAVEEGTDNCCAGKSLHYMHLTFAVLSIGSVLASVSYVYR